jgi:hypothetical protein
VQREREREREPGQKRHGRLWIQLTVAAVVECAFWGPILIPFLIGAAATRMFTVDREDPLSKAVAEIATLLGWGLGLDCAALLVLNAWPGLATAGQLDTGEATLARIRLLAESWPTDSLAIQLLILTPILIVLALLSARLQRAVNCGQRAFGVFKAVLVVLGTFVIYGQVPLQQALAREQSWIQAQFRVALGTHRAAVERELLRRAQVQAGTLVLHNLNQLSRQQLAQLARNAKTIYDEVQTREQHRAQEFAHPVAGVQVPIDQTQLHTRELEDIWQIAEHVFAIAPPQVTFARAPSAAPLPARSVPELDRQLRELAAEQDATRAAEQRERASERALERATEQARSSLTEAFTSHLPRSVGPAASTVIGIFLDALGEWELGRRLAQFTRSSTTPQVDGAALTPSDVAALESELAQVEPTPNPLQAGLLGPAQLTKLIEGVVPAAAPRSASPGGPQPPSGGVDPLERALIRDEIDRGAHPFEIAASGEQRRATRDTRQRSNRRFRAVWLKPCPARSTRPTIAISYRPIRQRRRP